MVTAVLFLVFVAFAAAVPLTMLARRIGRRLNALDGAGVPGQVKVAARRVPNTGGIGIFATVVLLLGGGVLLLTMGVGDTVTAHVEGLASHLPGVKSQAMNLVWLLACAAALHVAGVIDDRKPLGAMPKLLVMVAVATAAVLLTNTRLLTLLDGHVGGAWLSVLLTVVWIVAVTNAMNFIDNMDGLCGGVACIAGSCFLAAALLHGQWFVAATLAVLVGACLGFLVFNFPWREGEGGKSASVFMGDSGSLVVGFLMAVMAVRITYTQTDTGLPMWHAVLTPVVVLAVPLYDMLSVTAIRLTQGKSPFVGDLQHLSHRLNFRGLTKRDAVIVICGLTAITALGGVILQSVAAWQAVVIGSQTALVLVVLAVYEYRASRGDS